MPIPILIDTDPGIDDALAIALAVRSSELQVLGISTVYGNATAARTTRNARLLLERLGAGSVPVWRGADRPLVRDLVVAAETHGEEGLGYAAVPPVAEDGTPPARERRDPGGTARRGDRGAARTDPVVRAPLAILRALHEATRPVTIVALGPLTNVALALALDRGGVRRSVREIIWMGGSAGAPGNTTPVSEFNAWSDPEAARAVLAAGMPVRMVGLDATRCVLMRSQLAAELSRHSDADVRWWAEMWRFYVEFHRRSEGLEGCVMNDPLAVAVLLRPGLARWAGMHVAVDCSDGLTRGQTICDRFGFTGERPNVSVCLEADGEAALALALERGLGVRL